MDLFAFALYIIGLFLILLSCVMGLFAGQTVARQQDGIVIPSTWTNAESLVHLLATMPSAALLVDGIVLPSWQTSLAYITFAGTVLSFLLALLSANRMYSVSFGMIVTIFHLARLLFAVVLFMGLGLTLIL